MFTKEEIQALSKEFNLEEFLILAVFDVEALGAGFETEILQDGKEKRFLKILFEGHVFWDELKKAGIDPIEVQKKIPNVCYPKWTRDFYTGSQQGEWYRRMKAKEVHEEAAKKSASYGAFQIMGYNYKNAGYSSVSEMIEKFISGGELEQLRAFLRYITAEKIIGLLRSKQWAKFAYRYNGPGYAKNNYDTELAKAYLKHSKKV